MSRVAYQRAFQELTGAEIEMVMAGALRLSYPSEDRIMREGEDQNRILVILDGQVRVVRYARDGREMPLSDPLGPGDTVGEMSFIDGLGASATLIATTDVAVDSIDRDLIAAIAADRPGFQERFYHSLLFTVIRRLRMLDHKVLFPA